MANLIFFHKFKTVELFAGTHDGWIYADTDVLKLALSNTAPSVTTDDHFSDITEISAGNGYTAGGTDVQNAFSFASGVISVVATDITWTASGGAIGPFRYLILYNDTASNDELIGYWDVGSKTILNGQSYPVEFGSPIFEV